MTSTQTNESAIAIPKGHNPRPYFYVPQVAGSKCLQAVVLTKACGQLYSPLTTQQPTSDQIKSHRIQDIFSFSCRCTKCVYNKKAQNSNAQNKFGKLEVRSWRLFCALSFVLGAFALLPSMAEAATKYWVGSSGDSVTANDSISRVRHL